MPPLSGYRTIFSTTCYFVQKADCPNGLSFATHLVVDQTPDPFVSMNGWQLEAAPGVWLPIFDNGPLDAQLNLRTGELWIPSWPKEGWILEGVMQDDYLLRQPGQPPVAWNSLSPTWWGAVRANRHQYLVYRQLTTTPTEAPLSMKMFRLLTSPDSRYGIYELDKTGSYYISYVSSSEFFQEFLAGPYTPEQLAEAGTRVFLKRTGLESVLEMLEKKAKRPAGRPKKVA